jgi:type IX secretion system PorP/SprF family membrane protein
MKKVLFLWAFLAHTYLFAQQLPVYSQFFLNPYMYNPAFVGHSKYTEVYLSHRQQWVGIEGAPVTSSLSVHLPTKGRLAYGLRVYSDKRGLLSTTSTLFSVGYTAHLGENQYLRAGLSSGIGVNAIRMNEVHNPNDPALSTFMDNSFFLDGNVGINYQYKDFSLGVSLPKIFQRNMITTNQRNEVQIKRLDHFLVSAGYRFRFSDDAIIVEPQLLYQVAQGIPSQFEAIGIIYLRDRMWVGGSYRQNYGPTAFAGFKVTNTLRLGYGYELGTFRSAGFTNATHEFVLNMRFGQKKESTSKPSPARPVPHLPAKNRDTIRKTEFQPDSTRSVHPEKNPVRTDSFAEKIDGKEVENKNLIKTEQQPFVQADEPNPTKALEERIPVQKPSNYLELAKGHYVVVNAFRVFDNVLNYHEKLSDQYSESRYGYSSKTHFYYSYVLFTQDINRARYERNKMRKLKGFENTWVLTVE